MLDTLENRDDYDSPDNGITDPEPSAGAMQDEYAGENGDDTEAAYREFLCGKNLTMLTAYNWRLISMPCNTGDLTVQEIFSSLGTYGDENDFVMYEQSGSDNYETNDTHPNTDKHMLSADDTLRLGRSYWIITNADHNVTIDKTLVGLKPTYNYNASNWAIEDSDFERVGIGLLPDGNMTVSGNVKKFMAGNPFPYAFEMNNLYFSPTVNQAGTYHPMGSDVNDAYIQPVFYKHDSPETGPINGYEAVDASTPGFDKGGFKAMEGFFVIIKESNASNSGLAYPLMNRNGSGN
jgi:hypothetical protein